MLRINFMKIQGGKLVAVMVDSSGKELVVSEPRSTKRGAACNLAETCFDQMTMVKAQLALIEEEMKTLRGIRDEATNES